jgi:formate dehydrogenase major subunit
MQRAEGIITVVQEGRFLLNPHDDSRSMLFVLAPDAGWASQDLADLAGKRVAVDFELGRNAKIARARRIVVLPAGTGQDGTRPERGRAGQLGHFIRNWSLPRQAAGADHRTEAARSTHSAGLRPRLEGADRVGASVCPYCAVGCSTLLYARGGRLIHVEGNPESPVNEGTLCPKGAALFGLHTAPTRLATVKHRAPYATEWRDVPLDWALDRIAELTNATRDETFVEKLPDGTQVNHTLGVASLGGATLDNEENYLIKKRPLHG